MFKGEKLRLLDTLYSRTLKMMGSTYCSILPTTQVQISHGHVVAYMDTRSMPRFLSDAHLHHLYNTLPFSNTGVKNRSMADAKEDVKPKLNIKIDHEGTSTLFILLILLQCSRCSFDL